MHKLIIPFIVTIVITVIIVILLAWVRCVSVIVIISIDIFIVIDGACLRWGELSVLYSFLGAARDESKDVIVTQNAWLMCDAKLSIIGLNFSRSELMF